MAVNTTHPSYDAMLGTWQKIQDVYAGSEAVRAGEERYLPRPSGMRGSPAKDAAWRAYLARPELFPATSRTVDGLTGAIFRKDPQVDIPRGDGNDLLRQDITGTGVAMLSFMQIVTSEVLKLGRYAILLDFDTTLNRPVWSGFDAFSIINWDEEGGTFIVLKELTWVPSLSQEDMVILPETATGLGAMGISLAMKEVTTWRILSLVPDAAGNQVYRQDVWQEREDISSSSSASLPLFEHIETIVPSFRNRPLDFIPCVIIGPESTEWGIQQSVLKDLVNINLRYWRHSADYEHGLHLTCVPTPWVTGHNPNNYMPSPQEEGKSGEPVLILGSAEGIMIPEPDAKLGMLVARAEELSAMTEALETDKRDMATVGARLLEERPDIQETATAIRLRQSGDESILKKMANTVSFGLTTILRWDRWWRGETGDNADDERSVVKLNTDFVSTQISVQDMLGLVEAEERGKLSAEARFWNFSQGERIEPGITFEEEQARIEANPPLTMRLSMIDMPDEVPADATRNGQGT